MGCDRARVEDVFTSADGFPTDSKKAVDWQIKPPDGDSVVFTAQLPPGVYGASVLHDENKNGKMDKDFAGIPKEGYGVTNNPKPSLRAATFKESTFTLPPEGAEMTINSGFCFASDMVYSTFCACSRNFSSSALRVTTAWEMRLSLAFEPMVLTSRWSIRCLIVSRRSMSSRV